MTSVAACGCRGRRLSQRRPCSAREWWFISSDAVALLTHPRERLDHGIVITIPRCFEAESEPVFVPVAGVCPVRGVGPVVRVNDSPTAGRLLEYAMNKAGFISAVSGLQSTAQPTAL